MTDLATLALRVQLPGFPGRTLDDDARALFAEGLGGLCLFGTNTEAGPDAVAGLTQTIRDLAPGAVIAVDEEGGDVTRLHAAGGSPVLGAAALGVVPMTGFAALVLTSATGARSSVIPTRSFGSDPDRAARHVAAWVTGLQSTGVAGCVKHFPGHGDTAADSHLELPTVTADLTTLTERELVPFAAAVACGTRAVMTSHLLTPALDPTLPATLSRGVLGMLRERLAFDGVIVTDALDMAGVSGTRSIPDAAVLALDAGADLLCLGGSTDPVLVRDIQRGVVDAVRAGRLAEERLRDAAARLDLLPPLSTTSPADSVDDAAQLAGARRALEVDGPLPDLAGATVVRVTTRASIAIGDVPWGMPSDLAVTPGADDVPGTGPVVLQVRDAHRHPDIASLVARLLDRARPVVLVEWGWPGHYEGPAPRLRTHGFSRPMVAAVSEVLRAAGWDR
ncbi:MAG: glycoside hydrolase [Nocardioides sp.]|nr:glycoside hydrolase [Nocardioides sp.]